MHEILHTELPADMHEPKALPGVQPLADERWLRVDEAYSAQMAYRRQLIADRRDQVLWQDPVATPAVYEAVQEALKLLPEMGFRLTSRHIFCPDGHVLDLDGDAPLAILGQAVQEDICLLQKQGDEHILVAAVLCFPASWTLSEKAGKPLSRIHRPVREYDDRMTRRVQRLFDGVKAGRPLWRNNLVWYENPDLYQPLSEKDPARQAQMPEHATYKRAEKQCILRLPKTNTVLFSIHSYVLRARAAP